MTSQIIRISYDGPYRQLSTAPSSVSITVRDLCTTIDNIIQSNQNAANNTQIRQDEKRDMSVD